MKYQYLTCCVDSTAEAIDAMTEQARQITARTFFKHVSRAEVIDRFGYSRMGLKPENDYAVSFWKSKYKGMPCYYMEHSRIEYIWTVQN